MLQLLDWFSAQAMELQFRQGRFRAKDLRALQANDRALSLLQSGLDLDAGNELCALALATSKLDRLAFDKRSGRVGSQGASPLDRQAAARARIAKAEGDAARVLSAASAANPMSVELLVLHSIVLSGDAKVSKAAEALRFAPRYWPARLIVAHSLVEVNCAAHDARWSAAAADAAAHLTGVIEQVGGSPTLVQLCVHGIAFSRKYRLDMQPRCYELSALMWPELAERFPEVAVSDQYEMLDPYLSRKAHPAFGPMDLSKLMARVEEFRASLDEKDWGRLASLHLPPPESRTLSREVSMEITWGGCGLKVAGGPRRVFRDGSRCWVDCSFTGDWGEGGNPAAILSYSDDMLEVWEWMDGNWFFVEFLAGDRYSFMLQSLATRGRELPLPD